MLAVHLRNMETLIAELRDVVDAGGPAVDLRCLVERAKAAEGSLSWMVTSAAQASLSRWRANPVLSENQSRRPKGDLSES